jgi:1,4-alpha-glucan branching enzyme
MTPQSQPPQPPETSPGPQSQQSPRPPQTPLTPLAAASETDRALELIAHGQNHDPFAVLGPHVEIRDGRPSFVIRTCQPFATRVDVSRAGGDMMPMRRLTQGGGIIFEAVFGGVAAIFDYRLRVTEDDGRVTQLDDPYRYGRVLGDLDLHLLGEGTHYRAFEKLGSHIITLNGVTGVHFAVWAPNAERVSVVGDFNRWNGLMHPMRSLVPNGLWEIFIPGLGQGERYKYEIRPRRAALPILKADPYARRFETPPATASLTPPPDTEGHAWHDQAWMNAREVSNGGLDRPVSIYEVHPASWKHVPAGDDESSEDGGGWRSLTYREMAEQLVPYVKDMGFTHIELLPILEHPYGGSWGYQVTGFFAPTSRFGTPDDFKVFVDACHAAGIGVILDWVPGHFPKDSHGLAQFDGTALYEHADPRQGEHQDWGTLIFNYGRNEVRNFLLSSALFWLEEFHLDGLRVDAVASMLYLDYSRNEGEWVPNRYGGRENLDAVSFVRQLNEVVHAEHPGVMMIAEESTAWPAVSRPVYLGGLGFTYKWNMGWMHDILKYMSKDPVFRRWEHNHLTFSMLYAYNENFILPFSHDEVVHGKHSMIDKMPGDSWQKAANLRSLFAFMFTHPGKKLLFMGSEFAQWREWNHDEGLPWSVVDEPPHDGVRNLVRDLNTVYRHEPALYQVDFEPGGFDWIDCTDNENSVVSFLRRSRESASTVIVILNFTPIVREIYSIGVPAAGRYREVINTDAAIYGGSNVGNGGLIETRPVPSHGHAQTLDLKLPPLGALILKLDE